MNIETKKNRFLKDVTSANYSYLVSKWIFDNTPHVFQNNLLEYLQWKEDLSESIKVDSKAMTIVGSASLGFSLNPVKNFKLFDDSSDVDVAVISHHYFEVSWHCLRNMGAELYSLDQKEQRAIEDHVRRLIYWGTIATDKILLLLPFGNEWFKALTQSSKHKLIEGRTINIRIYKDYESLRAYHVMNMRTIAIKQIEKEK